MLIAEIKVQNDESDPPENGDNPSDGIEKENSEDEKSEQEQRGIEQGNTDEKPEQIRSYSDNSESQTIIDTNTQDEENVTSHSENEMSPSEKGNEKPKDDDVSLLEMKENTEEKTLEIENSVLDENSSLIENLGKNSESDLKQEGEGEGEDVLNPLKEKCK